MSRIANSNPTPPDPPAVLANLGIAAKHVCPFCGTITDKPEAPCKRCTMENTPLTRQATRARIGPWYVMQSRNPSAPGMKFNTLLALIRRGQVAARSVIRGPTTHQLWRFAIRVKGISREFGHCYSCGGDIERTATVCPRCSKSQELPANPDVLLEMEPHSGKTVFMEVKAKPGGGDETARGDLAHPSTPAPPEAALRSTRLVEPARDAPSSATGGVFSDSPPPAHVPPSPTATMAALAGIESPELAPRELQSRPRHLQTERILSPKELAAAFSLQFNPNSDAPQGRAPEIPLLSRRAVIGVVVIILLMLTVGLVFYVPQFRNPTQVWIRDIYRRLQTMTDTSSPPAVPEGTVQINPGDRPDWAMHPPTTSTPVGAPAVNTGSNPSDSPAPRDKSAPPMIPADMGDRPKSAVGTGAAQKSAAETTPTNQDLDSLAMQLRRDGLDAESRHDYMTAASYYEQVERLPREHWPSDTDQLLQAARKRTKGQ